VFLIFVDLIPKDVVQKWITYLQQFFPTVAFKSVSSYTHTVSMGNEMGSSSSKKDDSLMTISHGGVLIIPKTE
jgi:ribosome biogenesis GTPase A